MNKHADSICDDEYSTNRSTIADGSLYPGSEVVVAVYTATMLDIGK
jgi:hypothetical protein